jgi:DNA-binding MarR family transcriptional regulator
MSNSDDNIMTQIPRYDTGLAAKSNKGQLFTEIVIALFKVVGMLNIEGDNLTSEFGISSARWKVLGFSALPDTALTVSQIAKHTGQSRQSVQVLANEMEEAGLVAFRDNPYHKKSKIVAATLKGRGILKSILEKRIPWAKEKAAPIKKKELEMTLDVINRIINEMDK